MIPPPLTSDTAPGRLAPTLVERFLRAFAAHAVGRRWLDPVHRRLCDRVVKRWKQGGPPCRRLAVAGIPFVVELAEPSLALMYLGRGDYEPRTAAAIRSRLDDGKTFVDVGANRGLFTMLGAACIGAKGYVVAVEPNPAVVDALRAHVRWNGFADRVEIVAAALTDGDGDAVLTLPTDSAETALASLRPSEFALEHHLLDPSRTVRVKTTTFDALMAARDEPTVDLVKIDAENAEDLVVAGMRRTLKRSRPRAIICETTPESGAFAALTRAGYAATPLDVSPEGHGNYLFELPPPLRAAPTT